MLNLIFMQLLCKGYERGPFRSLVGGVIEVADGFAMGASEWTVVLLASVRAVVLLASVCVY